MEDDQGQQLPALTHGGPSLEQNVGSNEAVQVLHSTIQVLPQNYRRVLLMRAIGEIDTATTARKLRITKTNVKVRLHRTRTMLRRKSALTLTSAFAAGPIPSRKVCNEREIEDVL